MNYIFQELSRYIYNTFFVEYFASNIFGKNIVGKNIAGKNNLLSKWYEATSQQHLHSFSVGIYIFCCWHNQSNLEVYFFIFIIAITEMWLRKRIPYRIKLISNSSRTVFIHIL